MKHRPDMKLLEKFCEVDELHKNELAEHLKVASTNTVNQWITRGRLPKMKRRQILKFIKGKLQ